MQLFTTMINTSKKPENNRSPKVFQTFWQRLWTVQKEKSNERINFFLIKSCWIFELEQTFSILKNMNMKSSVKFFSVFFSNEIHAPIPQKTSTSNSNVTLDPLKSQIHLFFYKHLESDPSPQNCFYFRG